MAKNTGPKFTGSPIQLRVNYEHGKGISQIMEETGLSYATVQRDLRLAGTNIRTGGPAKRCNHSE